MIIRKLKNSDHKTVKKINAVLKKVSTVSPQWLFDEDFEVMFAKGCTKYSESRIIENEKGESVGFLFTVIDIHKLKTGWQPDHGMLIKRSIYFV